MKDEFEPPEPMDATELTGEHIRQLENSIRTLLNVQEPIPKSKEQACRILGALIAASDTPDLRATSVAALQRLCAEALILTNFVEILKSDINLETRDLVAQAMEMGKPPTAPREPQIQ